MAPDLRRRPSHVRAAVLEVGGGILACTEQ